MFPKQARFASILFLSLLFFISPFFFVSSSSFTLLLSLPRTGSDTIPAQYEHTNKHKINYPSLLPPPPPPLLLATISPLLPSLPPA